MPKELKNLNEVKVHPPKTKVTKIITETDEINMGTGLVTTTITEEIVETDQAGNPVTEIPVDDDGNVIENLPEDELSDFREIRNEVNQNEPEIDIPASLVNDPEAVGYMDEESQKQFYDLATAGLDLKSQHILDMGAGRGDFLNYLRGAISSDDGSEVMFDYTGYEINPLLCKAFDIKYNPLSTQPEPTIINKNWFEAEKDELVYDWVFNILSLSTNYDGYTMDKWTYLERTIELAMNKATKGVVFILLSDNGGVAEYTHFPIDELVRRIQDKYMFAIDRTTANTIYKIGIIK